MGRDFVIISLRFIWLVLIQVLIFNKLNFFGFINPLVYILFVLFFPLNIKKNYFILISFLFGLTLDFFDNTGGAHAMACLILAYLRPVIMKFSFSVSFEYQSIKIIDKITSERITFFALSIFIHHLFFFIFEVFRANMILQILSKAFFTTLATLFFSILIIITLRPRKN